jgi:hypothetical protein
MRSSRWLIDSPDRTLELLHQPGSRGKLRAWSAPATSQRSVGRCAPPSSHGSIGMRPKGTYTMAGLALVGVLAVGFASSTESSCAPARMVSVDKTAGYPGGAVEYAIRDSLQRAERDLSRVDFGALSSEARADYDAAKRCIQLAERAMMQRRHQYALTVAAKAATLASQLHAAHTSFW